MRSSACLLMTLALAAGVAWAQQTSSPGSPPQAPTSDKPPAPDQNGVYSAGPGIEAPYLTSPAMATWPANTGDQLRMIRLSGVIGADGSISKLTVLGARGDEFEAAAVAAVGQSKFAAGTLNGTAVPVAVCLRVPFVRMRPPVPRIVDCAGPNGAGGFGSGASQMPPGVTPPHVTHVAIPEYSDQARRKRIEGIVILSTLVNEQGEATEVQVEKGLGFGLDENAVRAVSQYRFQPAIDRDGKPVAVRIKIEVSYRLY
jgi:TonB family protein